MRPTIGDAKRRATVQTDDGLWGTLLRVSPNGGKTVIECGGRHFRVAPESVWVIPADCDGDVADHQNEAYDDWMEETGA